MRSLQPSGRPDCASGGKLLSPIAELSRCKIQEIGKGRDYRVGRLMVSKKVPAGELRPQSNYWCLIPPWQRISSIVTVCMPTGASPCCAKSSTRFDGRAYETQRRSQLQNDP